MLPDLAWGFYPCWIPNMGQRSTGVSALVIGLGCRWSISGYLSAIVDRVPPGRWGTLGPQVSRSMAGSALAKPMGSSPSLPKMQYL